MGQLTKPTYRLTFEDAVQVWLRHWQGEKQQDTAAHFGVNQGRISDVINEKKHQGSRQAALSSNAA